LDDSRSFVAKVPNLDHLRSFSDLGFDDDSDLPQESGHGASIKTTRLGLLRPRSQPTPSFVCSGGVSWGEAKKKRKKEKNRIVLLLSSVTSDQKASRTS
jgi:hypothetical protein